MSAQCFAKWHEDKQSNAYRDGTILQYGESWELLGNIILQNPGSAVPLGDESMNAYLKEHYQYFNDDGDYYEFSIDPLMRSLVELFWQKYPDGGVIRIYNLFNLKNPDSGSALEAFAKADESEEMMTPIEKVDFHNAPVIVATDGNVHAHPKLEEQLRRYIAKAPDDKLYAIVRQDASKFVVKKAAPDKNGLVESYHPSYTCKYGNETVWEEAWKALNSINEKDQESLLNPDYTFENLIVCESNRLAYSVAKDICENEETRYNPLIIHGANCLGKTHLVQSIGNCLKKDKTVVYTTAENFMNELLIHMAKQKMNTFREKYHMCDLLIVEDIENLANKERVQKELFFIIKDRIDRNRQTVFTSRFDPRRKEFLEPRLLHKLLSGLFVEIEPYDKVIIKEIIRKTAESYSFELSDDIVECIAKLSMSCLNAIDGMFKLIIASLLVFDMDIEKAENYLRQNECRKIIKTQKNAKGVR